MKPETKGWFDCLNAVAIEMEADKSRSVRNNIVNILDSAGITRDEVKEAHAMSYSGLEECQVLEKYEGILKKREMSLLVNVINEEKTQEICFL